ncbi:MAG: CBS domain-containing protein [Candidatus Bathyarchaeia archaeon]
MRVKEIMNGKHPFIHVDELATKARAIIRQYNLRILPVTDENKRLLGKVSRRDIMAISSSVSPIRVRGVMTQPRYVATVEEEVVTAIRSMLRVDAWHAPVVASSTDKEYMGVLGLESFIEFSIKTSPEKFAREVSEIMTRDVVACSPDDEVDNIWRLMLEKRLAGLPVVKNGKIVGIVTQKDLLERGVTLPTFESVKGRFKASSKISAVMNTNVIAVKPSVKAIRVAKVMVSKDIGRVPVKDEDGNLIGIVDREDIARLLIK